MELFSGNFAEAFRWHPLMPVTLALFAAIVARAILRFARPKTVKRPSPAMSPSPSYLTSSALRLRLAFAFSLGVWEKRALAALVALYLAVYIARMAAMFPHTQPMAPLETALWRQAVRALQSLFAQ
jgi:hypothetical protein